MTVTSRGRRAALTLFLCVAGFLIGAFTTWGWPA